MRVHEEFLGISGEVCHFHQGCLTYFVRLAGCNLRCKWCDTKRTQMGQESDYYAFADELTDRILSVGAKHVLITGGEPLEQKPLVMDFVKTLRFHNLFVSIETNGSIPFFDFERDECLSFVVDYKLPSSLMQSNMLPYYQYLHLGEQDFLKMVIANEEDFNQAILLLKTDWLPRRFRPVLSPMMVDGKPVIPIQFFINRLWNEKITDAILSVQIHNILNVR